MSTIRPCYVIQCKTNGLFLSEELSFVQMLSQAGVLHDKQEAVDTALDNLDAWDFEIFGYWQAE